MPYEEDQLFYREDQQDKQYAGVTENTELRYVEAESGSFPALAQAQFYLARMQGTDSFNALGTDYTYKEEGEDLFSIYKDDGKTLTAGQFLNEFGFEGKILHSPLSSLSGGERKRLFLIRLLMTNPNFLILDEPTNDFDIFTMNVLEQFLMQYQGCLLVVSHDRYFMDKVADTLFILEEDGNISGFVGKCSEYLELREQQKKEQKLGQKQELKKEEKPAAKDSACPRVSKEDPALSGSERSSTCAPLPRKRTYKEQKEFEALEAEIMELEDKKSVLEAQLSAGEKLDYESLSKAYNTLTASLEEKYGRWEELGLLL